MDAVCLFMGIFVLAFYVNGEEGDKQPHEKRTEKDEE
jgi:hypothetical protein